LIKPAKKTLLVGLGNPLSGDDGFGPLVLKRLVEAGPLPPGVTAVDAGTDLLNHIESFSRYDCIVLVDAVLDPEGKLGQGGRLAAMEEKFLLSWSETAQGVHQISPLVGIKLFRTLYPDAATQIILVGLFIDQLSHKPVYLTEDRAQQAVEIIRCLL
jgi:hydrogenase maturation protease